MINRRLIELRIGTFVAHTEHVRSQLRAHKSRDVAQIQYAD